MLNCRQKNPPTAATIRIVKPFTHHPNAMLGFVYPILTVLTVATRLTPSLSNMKHLISPLYSLFPIP
jgi:hypothetical protein